MIRIKQVRFRTGIVFGNRSAVTDVDAEKEGVDITYVQGPPERVALRKGKYSRTVPWANVSDLFEEEAAPAAPLPPLVLDADAFAGAAPVMQEVAREKLVDASPPTLSQLAAGEDPRGGLVSPFVQKEARDAISAGANPDTALPALQPSLLDAVTDVPAGSSKPAPRKRRVP
jgi:hypothetical protein